MVVPLLKDSCMTRFWERVMYGVLSIELLIFCGMYYWGEQGLYYLASLKKERIEKACIIDELHNKLEELQDQIEDFSNSEFLKEKFARERLYMKKDGEVIYFR